jgi:hypothetical protein
LLALEQQHALRKIEIETRAQGQRIAVEAATRNLLIQLNERRLYSEFIKGNASIEVESHHTISRGSTFLDE